MSQRMIVHVALHALMFLKISLQRLRLFVKLKTVVVNKMDGFDLNTELMY